MIPDTPDILTMPVTSGTLQLQAEVAALHQHVLDLKQCLAAYQQSELKLHESQEAQTPVPAHPAHAPDSDLSQRVGEHTEALQLARFALDHAPEGIYWLGPDSRHIYVNHKGCRQLGYTREELLSMTLFDIDPDIPSGAWQDLWETRKQQGAITFAARHRRKDGSIFPVEITANFVSFNDKELICTYVRDSTSRVQAEENLRVFQAIVENAPDGIAITRLDHTVTYANPAFLSMTGYSDDALGKHINEFYAEDNDTLEPVTRTALEQGFWRGILTYRHKDGTTIQGHLSLFTIFDDEGVPIAMARIVRDITEQMRRDQEMLTLKEQVIETQRETLRELSSPLIPLSGNIVLMPLIGAIDSQRAQDVMESLLEGVAIYHSTVAIVDITGVQVVDTEVANALVQTAQAVKLLGAQVIVTGIRPSVAQTLVNLGTDLSSMVTLSSLQRGIAYAAKVNRA
jgi:PAS domain S-box-containing protein